MTPSADSPSLRASDSDRERAVNTLRAHAGEGRLEPEELEQRVEAALRARTVGDLEGLIADLPAVAGRGRLPARAGERRTFQEHLRTFVAVNVLLIVIWALTGFGYFWPIWPLMGWGIGLLAHAGCTPRRSRRRSGSLAAH